MDYIILDLEWNQPVSKNSYPYLKIGDRFSNEIIEIGAVRIDSSFKTTDTFKAIVRPKYYKKLNSNVLKITQLDKDEIKEGQNFLDAILDFREWCGTDFSIFTWGRDDIYVLKQNLDFYGVDIRWISDWYNLQAIYGIECFGNRNQRSLSSAIEHLGIEQSESKHFHDALDDAYYTAKVFLKLDMERCIKEYDSVSNFETICRELEEPMLGPFSSKKEALRDKKVSNLVCPQCKLPLSGSMDWLNHNDKYVRIANCPTHGPFLARLKFIKQSDGTLKAKRTIRKAPKEQLNLINRKREMKQEKARAYKKSKKKFFARSLFKKDK